MSKLEKEVLLNLGGEAKINDDFQDKQVLIDSHDLISLFVDFAHYLECDLIPSDLSFHQRKKFMHDVKKLFWDEPYFFYFVLIGIFVGVCLRFR